MVSINAEQKDETIKITKEDDTKPDEQKQSNDDDAPKKEPIKLCDPLMKKL